MTQFIFKKPATGAHHVIDLNPETPMGEVVSLLTENLGEHPAKAALLFSGKCVATAGFNHHIAELYAHKTIQEMRADPQFTTAFATEWDVVHLVYPLQ